jgi:alpha-mannosidase
MSSRALYLICNSHIDPVWLWEWEEGAAEALSTFRQAAACCEEFESFVFNHNEALLYRWVENYEPELFSRIQKLVKKRKWHPMGGWFLQPDCNMPSGESFVRQILAGKLYFRKKFGVRPKTAVNLDPFGHTRGLVQILKKAGYDSYLFCRPGAKELSLPADDFVWVGYDGSEVLARRAGYHYNSERGKARERVEKWLEENEQTGTGLLLWGIGDHGGGPSRFDLTRLQELIAENSDRRIRHGIPEDYFRALRKKQKTLPRHSKDLNPWAVGCYTTMALVKQKHRLLEGLYFLTEKMVTSASAQGLIGYPHDELRQALEDLLFCEFHDILPGSSVSQVEAYALQRMDHGLELLARLRAKAFFALLSGQQKAEEGEFPVFVYNPHPYPVDEVVICEFQPQEPNFNRNTFWLPEVEDENGAAILFQLEKESANISVDQRKRVVFHAKLKPSQMNRFSCRLKEVRPKPEMKINQLNPLKLRSENLEVIIDNESGLVEAYRANGLDFLKPGSFCALVVEDYPDPWGMLVRSFRKVKGRFALMSKEESARFAAVDKYELGPVRIIEDGPVRTVAEALFKYNNSTLCQRYKVPKRGTEFELELRVFWNEKDRMLKLSVPTLFKRSSCTGQVAYGVENFDREGEELVAQKWVGVVSNDKRQALTVINSGTHGFDFAGGELRFSLLRSAAYAAHPVGPGIPLVRQDRFEPRIDQGERIFRFWINGGDASHRLSQVEREAQVKNEPPLVLCCSPPGTGEKPFPGITISDSVVEMTAFKMAEEKRWLIIRLFEPTGQQRKTQVAIPYLSLSFNVSLKAFEVKSFAVDIASGKVSEVDLVERRLSKK